MGNTSTDIASQRHSAVTHEIHESDVIVEDTDDVYLATQDNVQRDETESIVHEVETEANYDVHIYEIEDNVHDPENVHFKASYIINKEVLEDNVHKQNVRFETNDKVNRDEIESTSLGTNDVHLHQNGRREFEDFEDLRNGNTNVTEDDFQNTLQLPENFSNTMKLSDYTGLPLEINCTNTAVFDVDKLHCNDSLTNGLNVELKQTETNFTSGLNVGTGVSSTDLNVGIEVITSGFSPPYTYRVPRRRGPPDKSLCTRI